MVAGLPGQREHRPALKFLYERDIQLLTVLSMFGTSVNILTSVLPFTMSRSQRLRGFQYC